MSKEKVVLFTRYCDTNGFTFDYQTDEGFSRKIDSDEIITVPFRTEVSKPYKDIHILDNSRELFELALNEEYQHLNTINTS